MQYNQTNGRTHLCITGDIYGGLRNNLGEVEKMGTLFLSLQKKKGWTTSVLQYYALHYMHLTKLEVLKTIPYCGFLRRVNLNLYNSLLQIVSIPIAPKNLLESYVLSKNHFVNLSNVCNHEHYYNTFLIHKIILEKRIVGSDNVADVSNT